MLGTGRDWAGGSEPHVLSILREASDRSSSSDELAAKIRDWPTRYHLSRLRSKILSPLRIEPGTRVLDLGGGTGPLTRKLAELGAEVLLVDGSPARAEAAAERCRGLENVSVAVGTVLDLADHKPFDVVLAVGLLEYGQSSAGGSEELLRQATSLLAPEGVVAVAIENAIGLKYLLGYAEDHVGLPWVGWEGYLGIDHVRKYSRLELASMLAAAGLTEQAWFYPFPDYKLPTVIVSDAGYALDEPGVVDAIVPQPCSPDASLPILLADARAAHRTMLRAGLGRDVANSFVVVGARTSEALEERVDRETLAWLSGSERSARFMRNRRLVSQSDGIAIVDDGVPSGGETAHGWLMQRRFLQVPFQPGEPLDLLVSNALAAADAGRTGMLLTLWAETLRQHVTVAESARSASPFDAEEGRLALPGEYLDSQPANFVFRDGVLHRIDAEWQARGSLDFDLVCVRGLFHFAVDVLTRGISARRANGRDVASVIAALARAGGIEDCERALDRLPAAEGQLQGRVRNVPVDGARAEIDRLLRTSADELVARAAAPIARAPGEREADLEAELTAIRQAHEAQSRHLVAERLAFAEQFERAVEPLREEVEWRKTVMEAHEEQLELIKNSRSLRYTEPLRRLVATLRRR